LAERGDVIFVGGTAFSGADAVAALLGGHPDVVAIPVALRFHSDPRGIPALLNGRLGLEDFISELRSHEEGSVIPSGALDEAVAALREGYHSDPLESCRTLFWTAMAAIADLDGARALVEASPGNLLEAQTLVRLVPGARFVHVARDGRDVAGLARESDAGPHRMAAALEWWADGLREIERGFRGEEDGAPYAIPEERFATVVLDELTAGDRDAAYGELLSRLGLQAESPRAAPLESAAIARGRWHRHERGPAAWFFKRRYARTLSELDAEGNHAAPPLRAIYGRLG